MSHIVDFIDSKYKYYKVPNFNNCHLDDVSKSKTGKHLLSQLLFFCLALEDIHPLDLLCKHNYLVKHPNINYDVDFIPEDLEIPVLKRQ